MATSPEKIPSNYGASTIMDRDNNYRDSQDGQIPSDMIPSKKRKFPEYIEEMDPKTVRKSQTTNLEIRQEITKDAYMQERSVSFQEENSVESWSTISENIYDRSSSISNIKKPDPELFQPESVKQEMNPPKLNTETETNRADSLEYKKHITPPVSTSHNQTEDALSFIDNVFSEIASRHLVMIEDNWSKCAIAPIPGINLIAVCKNLEIHDTLKTIICPMGMFVGANGYCSVDREIYRLTCPQCKFKIIPDNSLCLAFYQCKYTITYQTEKMNSKSGETIEGIVKDNELVYGRVFNTDGTPFNYLEVVVE
ncbi:hypothetical protein LOD99_5910 [Oopsacas minuta]|uniref:Uncharacterized protein n=1 Tax=Oopsacas minuta TaxID=111878 RepID=A0AAV7JND9_9METZ|nr:hypothetical protein LOD99_5910 [Oopsacas minuta]